MKNIAKEKVPVHFGSSVYPTSLYFQTGFPKTSASGLFYMIDRGFDSFLLHKFKLGSLATDFFLIKGYSFLMPVEKFQSYHFLFSQSRYLLEFSEVLSRVVLAEQ
jgi:hypothetical protein